MTALWLAWAVAGNALAAPPDNRSSIDPQTAATIRHMLCRMIESAARANGLPIGFFTRLVWQESGFRTAATSPAGAQGIAQFMPQTAAERGLADPLDPEQAIGHAAGLLAELRGQFGNLGLAAAAYNGGANRVARWLRAQGDLPAETRNYVFAVTERPVEEWAASLRHAGNRGMADEDGQPCIVLIAELARAGHPAAPPSPTAEFDGPWQTRLDRSLSNALALMSDLARTSPARPEALPQAATARAAAEFCERTRALGVADCAVYGR